MRHFLKLIIIGVFVVMSLVLASYIVLTEFRPETELRRMLISMSGVQSINQSSGLSWTRQEPERVTTTFYSEGVINLANPSEIEHDSFFRVVRLGNSNEYVDLSGQIKTLDGTTYLTYAPPGPEVPGVSFSEDGVWVSFEEGDLPSWGSIIPGLDIPFVINPERSSWNTEAIERLRNLLAVADVFDVSYDDLTQLVDGVNTRMIDASFNPQAIRAFLRDLLRTKYGRDITDEERLLAEKQASALERLTLRLWVGDKDHLLYRVQAAGAIEEEGSTDLIPVDLRIDFSDFNELYKITKPAKSISFDKIFQNVFKFLPSSGLLDHSGSRVIINDDSVGLPIKQTIKTTDPDEDGLDNILESFYGTDPNNSDTDGDGESDGYEVSSGQNPRGTGSLFGFGLD